MNSKIYQPSQIFDGDTFLEDTAVQVEQGTVQKILPAAEIPAHAEVTKWPDTILAPAYKDLQIYGGNGQIFSLFPSVESLKATYAYSIAGGATAFMATVPTSSPELMAQAIDAVFEYWQQELPGLLGLHLEGPYLNAAKSGAHNERFLQKPKLDEVKKLIERGRGTIKMMTVAPECCPDEVIKYLADQNIVVSAGHSNATYHQACRGFDLGITTCTHLYNAMSGFKHREPGLVGAIFDRDIYASIIADGFHSDSSAVRIADKIMGNRLFFITDAITEAHTDSYQYILKDDRIVTEDGTLAGSCLSMEKAVQKAIEMGVDPAMALKKASLIPAEVIGQANRWGRIAPGYQTDWVLLDHSYRVKRTMLHNN